MNNDALLHEKIEVIHEEIYKINEKVRLLDRKEKEIKKGLAQAIINKEYYYIINNSLSARHNSNIKEINDNILELQKKLQQVMEDNIVKRETLYKELRAYNSLLNKFSKTDTESDKTEVKDFFSELLGKNPELSKKLNPIVEEYENLNITLPNFNIAGINIPGDNSDAR